ncbi:Outer membrane protein transport protein (OMPP1/FadL/TodX) [Candidatus Methanoperedenaceae archaeon GB37]|nr:Outer membrane protein transport protein (OMPP1/FadL/TodX) [Candidatus Methanoperedenaceae archaeon GB37]
MVFFNISVVFCRRFPNISIMMLRPLEWPVHIRPRADRPSAVFYNPAGMNQLKGTSLSTGGIIIIPRTTYKNPVTWQRNRDEAPHLFCPNFFITHKISDKLAVGFGILLPFGLSTDWPEDWEGRFIATYTKLKTYFLNPAISWQVHPRLSLAVGFDYVFSNVEMKRAINLSEEIGIPGLPEGRSRVKGDGEGQGFNLGLLYHITDNIDLGISYRSRIDINYDGDAQFNIPATGIGAIDPLLANTFQNGDVLLIILICLLF